MVADALGVELDEMRLRGRVRADHRRPRSRVVDDPRRVRRRRRRQLEGNRRRQDRRRAQRRGGARARRSSPTGRSSRTAGSIEVDGRPTVTNVVSFLPPPDFEAETIDDFMVLGHIMTAMPAINAIPAVVAAAPGIATYTRPAADAAPRRGAA